MTKKKKNKTPGPGFKEIIETTIKHCNDTLGYTSADWIRDAKEWIREMEEEPDKYPLMHEVYKALIRYVAKTHL